MFYALAAAVWGLVGWCGTRGPRPRPEPLPGPRQVFILGFIGGIAGGFAYMFAFALKAPLSPIEFGVACIGAFVGGFVFEELGFQFTKK
jgi:hypothetical protein